MIKRWTNAFRRRVRLPASSAVLADVGSAREAFAGLRTRDSLAAAATARIGPALSSGFRRYVAWLDRYGYDFGSCEDLPLSLDRRRVYLRYDVHIRDLFGAFAVAALHEELQIPGSFQICWAHSRAEVEVADLFLKLRLFDSRFVQFGLHCSPESRWLVADRFGERDDGLREFVNSGAARLMMADWLRDFCRDGEDAMSLVEARCRGEASFSEVTASFRRHFGPVQTVSGHGTPLSALYLEAVSEEPQLSALGGYFHAVSFLTPTRIRQQGFGRELTQFAPDDLPGQRIMFEGPIEDMASRYRERMSQGGGFVVLFHPGSWTGDYFRPFLEAIATPDAPSRRSAAGRAADGAAG